MMQSSIIYFFAGVAFFLYGLQLTSSNLQKISNVVVKSFFRTVKNKNYVALSIGVFLSIVMQSSTAVTSMIVSLASSQIITLVQSMSLILGAAIGTTLTVQILSFNIYTYGLPIFTLFFLLSFFFVQSKKKKRIFRVMMGIGLLLFGLQCIQSGVHDIKNAPIILEFIRTINQNPMLAIGVSFLFTVVMHSSVVTLGVVILLLSGGYLNLLDASYWVYGANIGSTIPSILLSWSSNYIGQRVAWLYFLFKVLSVFLFFFFTEAIIGYFFSEPHSPQSIANFHMAFNCVSAFVFYFLIDFGAKGIKKIIPNPKKSTFSLLYIKDSPMNVSIVLNQLEREILRMSDIVSKMLDKSIDLFLDSDPKALISKIHKYDSQVDYLNEAINKEGIKLLDIDNGSAEEDRILKCISFSSDLESVGDSIDKILTHLAKKKNKNKLSFSKEDWSKLTKFKKNVSYLMWLASSYFHNPSIELLEELKEYKKSVRIKESNLRLRHIQNRSAPQGVVSNIALTSIYLDVVSEYRHIAELIINISYYHDPVGKSQLKIEQSKSKRSDQ